MTIKLKLLLAILVLLLCSCQPSSKVPFSLPTQPIVFQFYPVVDAEQATILGFIEPDGTGLEKLPIIEKVGGMPTWSADGRAIFYYWWPGSMSSASVHGGFTSIAGSHVCKKTLLQGHGRPRPVPGVLDTVLVELVSEQHYTIAQANPFTCEIGEPLYTIRLEEWYLRNPALSSRGLLAVQYFHAYGVEPINLMVVDPSTGEKTEIGTGQGGAWSPDGEWLAYTAYDGIYTVRFDGTESKRVYDYDSVGLETMFFVKGTIWGNWPPYPEWSPDGNQLVFHLWEDEQFKIHKLNLETGEDTIIFEGGLYPHWRWP